MSNYLDTDETISLDRYINLICDPIKKNVIRDAFDESLKVTELLGEMLGKSADEPHIQVISSGSLNAEAASFLIRITSGLIEHCIKASRPPLEKLISASSFSALSKNQAVEISLTWIIAHEWSHILRCHGDVENELGSETWIKRALEHDADQLALAATYRKLQIQYMGAVEDIDIRKIVLCSLFWSIRSLPSMNVTHEDIESRTCNFLLKLASVSENPYVAPDNSIALQITRARTEILVETLITCDKLYVEEQPHSSSIFEKFVEKFQDESYLDITKNWERVAPFVAKHS